MNRTWVGVTLIATSLGAGGGCGQGRAIFNVDVYSWLMGSPKDTVHYIVPPTTPGFVVPTASIKIDLPPGLGSSFIDTVKVTGTADFHNDSGGPGTLAFQVYLASDSLGTFNSGTRDSIFTPPVSVSLAAGVNTQTGIPLNVNNLSPSGNSLFTKSVVWIRLAPTVSNTGGTFMGGRAVLTSLLLRVVVQDKLF